MSIQNYNSEFLPLGIITKTHSNPDIIDFDKIKLIRLTRYALQDIARDLLSKERVSFCLRRRISKDTGVKVMFNPVRQKAHYANLIRCGSVWHCPICTAQISEKRRNELKIAMKNFQKKKGGLVYLLTLTNPHYTFTNLKQMLLGQRKALKYLWSDRKGYELFKSLGKFGHVIATEVTYSDNNGFHPHFHILLFMTKKIDSEVKLILAENWQNCCKKAGLLVPSFEHGVDLRDGKYADNYVSKWGLEDEMTKGHTKKGRENSMTPFDLLKQSVECPEYGRLFQLYAHAFKGERQLNWSRGLKKELGIFDQTDEELSTETEKESVEVRELEIQLWHLISKYKYRAEFLQCVEDDLKNSTETANALVMRLAEFEASEIKNS